ncbi:hypothetical protein [Chelativorans sp. YIM 93263]|uniref:hypothetical protein n=1 Tax=Chelativorans sp. YIM 93263 TaxID=2906648 RepID=UPI0023780F1D|nr:hypothetical protein [Chelativorans sp. YIM 93263]
MMIYPYPDPYELTPDDIAWFRSCRSLWIDAEAGAPGIFGPGLEPETMRSVSGAVYKGFQRRMEPIQCAAFLHATFRPGRYAISGGETGAPTVVEVTETDITLLKRTSWRAFTIDSKRPYRDLNNYPVEMAQALGLQVSKDDQGYATIDPKLDQELRALHKKSQFVLQAYIEHAELSSGHWLIPFNGWDAIISPRCRPVGQAAIDRYKAAMVVLAERARNETAVELVVPLINTSAELFASP